MNCKFSNWEDILIKILYKANFLFTDEQFIKLRWLIRMKYLLNLRNPQTFCEKIQWLKLYDRNPEYTQLVDKYAVKEYVKKIIGEEYIVPTLAIWDKPEDIEWESLPNSFVLKTTHGGGGGGVVLCVDKHKLDIEETVKKLNVAYKSCIYNTHREWPYKNVRKRILAEKMLIDKNDSGNEGDLPDYKFFCFNGEPLFCQVIRNRRYNETIDFYDMQWNHMPYVGLNPNVSNGFTPVNKPISLEKMIEICRKLGGSIPFTRIDLYLVADRVYFGEITLYPASGMGKFNPTEWDKILGDYIVLPKLK